MASMLPNSIAHWHPFRVVQWHQLPNLSLTLSNLAAILILVIFLLNIRSWPFAWHLRLFKSAIWLQLDYYALVLRHTFSSRRNRMKAALRWLDSKSPIGVNPFEHTVTYQSRAYLDDCDLNLHMSNSSYAKTLDAMTLKTILTSFLPFFAVGGWLPLGATYFHFIKEIPMFAKYEVRMNIASWDGKWIYFVSKFVTKRSRGQRPTHPSTHTRDHVSIHIPSSTSGTSAPPTPEGSSSRPAVSPEETLKAVSSSLLTCRDADDLTVHAIAISRCCFKMGRITVPPSLVLASSGFSSSHSQKPYSHSNPPPHWKHVDHVRHKVLHRADEQSAAFFRDGWKTVAQDDRWWEAALLGAEDRRVEGLRHVNQIILSINELGKL